MLEGRREKVDRQLVRSIIGLKHRLGLAVHWTNQLANELQNQYEDGAISALYSLNKSMIYGLQI